MRLGATGASDEPCEAIRGKRRPNGAAAWTRRPVSQTRIETEMTVPSASPVRPFSDSYLLGYSAEHVVYEFDMFLWLAAVCSNPLVTLGAPTPADATRLSNVLIEAFVVHLRNIIDFLYPNRLQRTDVVAEDFFAPNAWQSLRPAISSTMDAARVRANKEIAHLTTDRIAGSPPAKAWDFEGLARELRPLMELVADNALPTRLSPKVAAAIR